jgi:hypothetical protein
MTNIRKTIQDLKPGTRYLLRVEAVDNNINSVVGSKTIIVETPTDQTIPGQSSGLQLFSSGKSIMFKLNPSQDLDFKEFEYELYNGSLATPNLIASRN